MREEIITIGECDKILPFRISLAGITYPDPGYHIFRKNARNSVIEYVVSGSGTVIRNGCKYHVEKGDVYLLLCGDDMEYFPDGDNLWEKMWCNIEGELPCSLSRLYNIEKICRFRDTECMQFFRQMLDICRLADLSGDEKSRRCAVIFHQIISLLSVGTTENSMVKPEAAVLKNYIDGNIGGEITVKDLAAVIHRCESQTNRIFRSAYGKTPYEYLLTSRISAAKRMLDETELLIREIAYRVGFSDEHYFSSLFKQKTGFSPGKYRKRNNTAHQAS